MRKKIVSLLICSALFAGFFVATAFRNDFFEISKQMEIFTEAYKRINMNYVDEVSPSRLMDVALKSMFEELDPYTNYWNAQEVQEGRLLNSGNYTGIGATIQSKKDRIIIKEVMEGTPADKAGLKIGDEIIRIDGQLISDFEEDAGELLKGSPGSEVELNYKRQGQNHTTRLKRERTVQKFVPFYQLTASDVGYIKLSEFGATTTQEVRNALRDLKEEGAQKIILDLRDNPGGLLEEAVHLVNLFVPKGELVVTTQSSIEKYNKTYLTQRDPVDTEIPLVVLINARSASASEIVSGGLQDLDRAVIVGAQSFGKGLVQRVTPLNYGTQMKMTISRYYTPSGRGIQALDYRHRDREGKPLSLEKEEYRAYITKKGRKVYEKGGVEPDVALESAKISTVTQHLLAQNVLFDFATAYSYQNEINSPEEFQWSDKIFADFKTYLSTIDFSYQTQIEKEWEETFRRSPDSELKNALADAYKEFMDKVAQAKESDLDKSKEQIQQQLTREILKRYFYAAELYDYSLVNDPEVLKALEVLNSTTTYQSLLSK